MPYVVKVISGADTGKLAVVEGERFIMGRSPEAGLKLTDASAGWEHAFLQVVEGKLYIENLAAAGTKVSGRKVVGRMRVNPDEVIELSPTCTVRAEARGEVAGNANAQRAILLGVAVVVLLALVGGFAVVTVMNAPQAERPLTVAHWQRGYGRLAERLDQWTSKGQLATEFANQFREAWRIDQAGNAKDANARWLKLQSALMTLPIPGAENGRPTFGEAGSEATAYRNLNVVLGWDPVYSLSNSEFATDKAYAKAMYQFIVNRVSMSKLAAMAAGG
jgi:hypothetical protein